MSKFKEGDVVVALKNEYDIIPTGSKGVITSISPEVDIKVEWDVAALNDVDTIMYPDELELYAPPPALPRVKELELSPETIHTLIQAHIKDMFNIDQPIKWITTNPDKAVVYFQEEDKS